MKLRVDDTAWWNDDEPMRPRSVARTFFDGFRVMAILAFAVVLLVRAGVQRRA